MSAGQGRRLQRHPRVLHRPHPAPCLYCRVRQARPNGRYPHLATGWCRDQCRDAWYHHRDRDETRELANQVRTMLGLPAGRGPQFTRPELAAMARRLGRLLPYGGMAMMPASRRTGPDPRTGKRRA